MDTVTAALKHHQQLGRLLFHKGNETMHRRDKLTAFLKIEDAAQCYFRSAISYKACSRWREAGDSLVKCAKLYVNMKFLGDAANLYVDGAEAFLKIDKGESIKCYKAAITLYCELGRFDVAGRLERKLAHMSFESRHWEEAAEHYKRASSFLSGENSIDQSDICLEHCAECYIEIGELAKAQQMFEVIAEGCAQSNLRRFNCAEKLFKAALCMVGIPLVIDLPELTKKSKSKEKSAQESKLADDIVQQRTADKYNPIAAKIEQFEQLDYLWRCTKEYMFITNLLKFRLEWDDQNFIDHVYYYHNVRPLDRLSLDMIRHMFLEIQEELDRRVMMRKREEDRVERARLKVVKVQEAKALMREMGVEAAESEAAVRAAAEDSGDEDEDGMVGETHKQAGGDGEEVGEDEGDVEDDDKRHEKLQAIDEEDEDEELIPQQEEEEVAPTRKRRAKKTK